MSRSYAVRREDRIGRILHLIEFIEGRLQAGCSKSPDLDKAQVSAFRWAIEEIERFDLVEAALNDPELTTAFVKLAAISAVVNSRHAPSDADLARTKQLAREYGWSEQ